MIKKILIAVTSNENSIEVAKVGFDMAKQLNAECALISVIDLTKTVGNPDAGIILSEEIIKQLRNSMNETIDQLIKINSKDGMPKITKFILEGSPKILILKKAEEWNADMIVLGVNGKSGLMVFIMGSTAQHVVRHSYIPVLTVPSLMK